MFVDRTGAGTHATMLWSDSGDAWRHFRVSSNSSVVLLDSAGNKVDDRPGRFDAGRIEKLIADLG